MSSIQSGTETASPRADGMWAGRMGRKHYFLLAIVQFAIVFSLAFFLLAFVPADDGSGAFMMIIFLLLCILLIASLVVGISFSVRRVHDIGYTGWVLLLLVIPYVDLAVQLVLFLVPGKQEDNEYGPVPDPYKSLTDAFFGR